MHDPCNVYRGRYKEFIESVRLSRPSNDEFPNCEEHHIIPKSVIGTDDPNVINSKENLIYLTYQEHFIAHKLLVEENPGNYKLSNALWRMSNCGKVITPEDYEYSRKAYSDMLKIVYSGEGNPNYNTRVMNNGVEQHHIHVENVEYYKSLGYKEGALPRTDQARMNISKALTGIPCSNSKKKVLSLAQKTYLETHKHQRVGTHHSEISKSLIAQKASVRMTGEGNPMYGKYGSDHPAYGCKHSEESRRLRSECMKGNPSNTGKKCINDGVRNYFKFVDEIPYYLSLGYKEGRI